MRVALISDIHGNILALDAVLADIAGQEPVDEIVVAGDLVWAGPWPAEVVDRVQTTTASVVQGNTDAFFVRGLDAPPPGKRQDRFDAHLAWMVEQLGPHRIAYLAGLPFSHRISPAPAHDLLIVHANPVDLSQPITPDMSEWELDDLLTRTGPPDWEALAFGHYHTPFIRRWRGRLLVDVASAGLPMDGDLRAAYALLTWTGEAWQAEHRRVAYDAPQVVQQMRTGGMPRGIHFAERLLAATFDAA